MTPRRAGPISDWLGVRAWYLFGGVVCILITIAAFSIPAIMNVEKDPPPPTGCCIQVR